ncbi:MAG TPA: gliding motility-associated protein GldE [Chitinophagaceae bacterium]|nr:gliding motility-associated protein GldE [Chitinophagaceae bacterium]
MDPDSAYQLLTSILLNTSLSPNARAGLLVLILLLLIFTAIIAGSEVAFFSLSAKDINYLKQKEQAPYTTVLRLLEKPKHLLATLLIGNNFLSIGVIISTNLLYTSMVDLHLLFPSLAAQWITLLNVLVQVVLVTFFLVLFGEVLPKVYATQNNLRLSYFSAPLISLMDRLFSPLSHFLVSSTSFIEKKMNSQTRNEISHEDMETAIDLTLGHSATREEVNIFKGIVKFNDIMVKQIMRNRHDVSGIEYHLSFSQVKQQVLETGFSRLPVYNESLDEVKGILHSKDLLQHIGAENFEWHQLIRPAHFVYETKLIKTLLREFQLKHIHMAVVVDEFGGTSGIVTLEDILEEIIGDIRDEFDEDELLSKKIDDRTYIFEGKTMINDFCRVIQVPTETFDEIRGESDSLAGLVLEIAGRFPDTNTPILYRNFEFRVLQTDKMRLQKIKVTLPAPVNIPGS